MNKKNWIVILVIIAAVVITSIFVSMKKTEEPLVDVDSQSEESLISIRKNLIDELEMTNNPEKIEKIKETVSDINMKILMSPVIDDCSVEYVVQPRDTLTNIAKKYGTTVGLIQRINGISGHIIFPKQKLKVHTCKFSLAVDKSQNILLLKQNGQVIKTYQVSTGKDNCTPVGKFKVVSKLENPTWFKTGAVIPPDSPDNLLGTRWLGFDIQGYGIHGTKDEDSIGQQVSQGCVRMRNEDVEELYDLISVGTEVVIVD